MISYKEKYHKLISKMEEYAAQDIVIAFSGGVDSSLLLKLACKAAEKTGKKVYAVTVHTELHEMKDVEIAKKVADESGAIHMVIHMNELQDAGIENNPVDRCYLCKKYLFSELKKLAFNMGITTILEGTNEDDLHVYRPGIKALGELEIISPLADSQMTKEDVRKMASDYRISVANRPSAPCLATRFPYGTKLSYDLMERVERGETYIKAMGFYNVRIRVHGDIARIEVDEDSLEKFIQKRKEITSYLKNLGFVYITVDLEGFRSGSMDLNLVF